MIVPLLLLALHALCMVVWARRFLRLYAGAAEPTAVLPRAAVLLSVRGADPFLADCLHGLLHQDYPAYDVCIIIDSREDAAWETIDRARSQRPEVRLQVHVLDQPRPTCSLKVSALLQALATLDDDCELVALIDADVIPHASWLRDLAEPLGDRAVGAATGIRWYAPRTAEWGTLVRHLWNTAAVIHMAVLEIPWGGSLAIRTDVLRRSGLIEKWSRCLFEDVICFAALRQVGLKIRFVPQATMINRESIGLSDCFQFVRRQLLDARLYHPRWLTVLGSGLLSTAALGAALVLAIVAVVQGETTAAAALGGGVLTYFLVMILLLLRIEHTMNPKVQRETFRGTKTDTVAGNSWLKRLLALPLAQAVHCAGLISACVLRRVRWRGIAYDVHGPLAVRLIEYRPAAAATPDLENASVT